MSLNYDVTFCYRMHTAYTKNYVRCLRMALIYTVLKKTWCRTFCNNFINY